MQFIDLKSQYEKNEKRIRAGIDRVLSHGKFILGPEVFQLEDELSDFVGCKHVVSCANGTDALQLALMCLGVGPGDAVITSPFSFFATAEVIKLVGATPVFVDIDEKTYNIDPKLLRKKVEELESESSVNLKAVIAVDIFGLPADYIEIEKICSEYGLMLVEDGAQSFGATYNNKRACGFGDIATTSFFPAKPLGCYGDGGALFTDDDDYAEVLRSLRVHGGGKDKYDNVRVGLNSRLDTIQAAILLEKLGFYQEEFNAKQEVAKRYNSLLGDSFITPLGVGTSAWAQYSIRSKKTERNVLIDHLKRNGIPVGVYYRQPLHLVGAFESLGYTVGDMPVAEKISNSIFSLPMHAYLSNDLQDAIVRSLEQ